MIHLTIIQYSSIEHNISIFIENSMSFQLTGHAISSIFGCIMSSHAYTGMAGAADHLNGNAILIHFAFFSDQCVDSCRNGRKYLR
jgi:hypothetical protein